MAKKYNEVYVVTSTDNKMSEPLDRCVAGAYVNYDKAVEETVDYIFERLDCRDDIVWGFAHDENHPEMEGAVESVDGETVYHGGEKKIREYLKNELEMNGCYYIYDGEDSFHFDIDGCDLLFANDGEVKRFVDSLKVEK